MELDMKIGRFWHYLLSFLRDPGKTDICGLGSLPGGEI